MEVQLEFPTKRGPVIKPEDVQRLVEELSKKPDWQSAEDLALALEISDRKVRKIAAAAVPQIVSSPGSPGYRLFQHCTVEEILHCVASLHSQAREMKKRADLFLRAYHKHYRGGPVR